MVSAKKRKTIRVQGKLHDVIEIAENGKKHKVLKPLHVEFHQRDALQIILGALILATPIGFTQEVWELAETLTLENIIIISFLSILIVSSFVYYNFYHGKLDEHISLFLLRIGSTYGLSLFVVGLFLLLIGKLPYDTNLLLAIKRVVLVSFPASMSAAVSDSLK